ncbi:hypothetical protein C4J81_18960 (plasmid) [Deltaproteobacteria bacterium Smac51]|nr:hypothetical protein C4J81_18960 [Deltaproteobacteria bacterium Smac51]
MQMTISIDPTTEEHLKAVAEMTRRDQREILESLVSAGVAEKFERLAAVQEALDDIEAGRVVDHEEVMRGAREIIKKAANKK